jgi:D-alanyl-D-alanine carboxypeptidase
MRDVIAKLMLATALRLPMPAPQGCVAVAIRHASGNWDGAARTRPFVDPDPVAPRFLIYSLTKTIIATLVLTLAEQQRLQLDDTLATYLPNAPFATQVTLRQLLRHSSGMPDYSGLPQYHAAVRVAPDRAWTAEEFIHRACANGLAFAPDKGWLYSNIGYMVLKQTVEQVCQMPFGVALKTLIVDPLSLLSMSAATRPADLRRLVPGHSNYLTDGGPAIDVRERYDPGWVAHGVVASNVADVAAFYDALFAGRIVSADSLNQMKQAVPVPQGRPPFQSAHYGLGLMCDPQAQGGAIYGHTGGGPGYHAACYRFEFASGPATIAVLVNAEIDAEGLAFDLAALLRDTQARV